MTERRIPKRKTVNIDEDTLEALVKAKGHFSINEFLKKTLPLPVNRSLKIAKSLFDDIESVIIENDTHKANIVQIEVYFEAIYEGLVLLLKRGEFDDALEHISGYLQAI